jgi:hypothetical protein
VVGEEKLMKGGFTRENGSSVFFMGGLQEIREMEGLKFKVEDGGSKDGKRRGSERFLFCEGGGLGLGRWMGIRGAATKSLF